jgi:hypothetical protein
MVSCSRCGAWGEIPPEASSEDWLCPNCSGPEDEPPAEAEPQTGRQPSQASGGPVTIGRDSGPLGSAAFRVAATGLAEQLHEMHAAVEGIKVGTAELDEVGRRLSQAGYGTLKPPAPEPVKPPRPPGVELLEEAARDAASAAVEFGRGQARETIDRADRLVREKGFGAVREAGDVARAEARRVAAEARQAAEGHLRQTAARGADAARRAVDETATKGRRLVRRDAPPNVAGNCALCNDRIVLGDRSVVCPDCGARYHADCYKTVGQCVSEMCRPARSSRPTAPKARPVAPPPPLPAGPGRADAPSRRCNACGAKVGDKTLVCPQCGRWLYGERKASAWTRRPETRKPASPAGCIIGLLLIVAWLVMIFTRL